MAPCTLQISLEPDLLDQIDATPEAREKGRAAFTLSAVRSYLKTKERQEIERQLAHAYTGEADSLLEEIEDLVGRPRLRLEHNP